MAGGLGLSLVGLQYLDVGTSALIFYTMPLWLVTIEWTIEPQKRTLSFKTVEAQFTDNSAEYTIEPSPDGKRSKITTIYYLRDKGGHPFPLHSLRSAIKENYVKALESVKRRALGPKAVVAH